MQKMDYEEKIKKINEKIEKRISKFSHIAKNGDSSRIRSNAEIYMRALEWVLKIMK